LEGELHRGGLFSRGLDEHRTALARCLARIGTPEARAALERGLRSPKGGVRKTCELALASLGSEDG
jgi:HEAT repeat protein